MKKRIQWEECKKEKFFLSTSIFKHLSNANAMQRENENGNDKWCKNQIAVYWVNSTCSGEAWVKREGRAVECLLQDRPWVTCAATVALAPCEYTEEEANSPYLGASHWNTSKFIFFQGPKYQWTWDEPVLVENACSFCWNAGALILKVNILAEVPQSHSLVLSQETFVNTINLGKNE